MVLECSQLNKILINNFPNLQEKYDDEVSWQEGDYTGSHVVYGDVFTPYLVECVSINNTTEIKKIFDFLEEILLMKDKYSTEVVAVSVIESVVYLLSESDYLQSFLGDETKVIFEEINATN